MLRAEDAVEANCRMLPVNACNVKSDHDKSVLELFDPEFLVWQQNAEFDRRRTSQEIVVAGSEVAERAGVRGAMLLHPAEQLAFVGPPPVQCSRLGEQIDLDRKSTRLNSSHRCI